MRLIVKAIRETRGNNEKSFIMITLQTIIYTSTIVPNVIILGDSKQNYKINKLLISIHMYTPYNLALKGDIEYT